MLYKKVLAASALISLASAAGNNSTLTTATPSVAKSCSFDDFTATNSGDIASVAACATAVGDITIEGPGFGTLELNGVKQIYGDLKINNATQASVLNAADLQLVSGELSLDACTILRTLNLAQLTTVGSLSLTALPALENLGLTSGITSANSVVVSDTGLSTLQGINVVQLEVFNVNNNGDINLIDSALQKVTDSLSISYNADKVDVKLDELSEVKNAYLQSISSLSVANLTDVKGSLSVSESNLESLDISKLKAIGNSLTITKNSDLEEIDFPDLKTIGGALAIGDNDKLSDFSGFPELESIGGAVTLNGTFNNGTFESLRRVSGGFNLRSDGDLACDDFNKLNSGGEIKGDNYYCSGANSASSSSSAKSHNSDDDSKTDSDDSSSSGSSSRSSSSRGAASGNGVNSLLSAISGAIALGLTLF